MQRVALAIALILSVAAIALRLPKPAPVYGWKEISRAPVPISLPILARAALADSRGQRMRYAVETTDAGATLTLTASTWDCVANCPPSR